MKQYCRYCANCCYGDFCYCEVKKRTMSDSAAKRPNRCKSFAFNPLDAFCPFDEDGKPRLYKPRKEYRKRTDYDENLRKLTEILKNEP